MKLYARITLILLVLSLVPVTVVGYFGYRNGIQTIQQDTFNRLISTNILKEAEFNRWIQANQIYLRAMAQRPLVRQYVKALSAERIPQSSDNIVYDKLFEDHLQPGISGSVGFVTFSILRATDGLIIISTEKELEHKYRENATYFKEGRRATYVDDVTYSLNLEALIMHISTPVKDDRNEVIAVLVGHVDWHEMSKIMVQRSGISASEESYLVNQFNYFVTETRFHADTPLTRTVYTQGVNTCLAGESGVDLYADYRGRPVIGAYRWMPVWNLCILTEEDQDEAFMPALTYRNVVLGVGGSVALLVTVLSLLFAQSITRRINHLVQGAREIGGGNLDYRIPFVGGDELGLLADALNTMARARQKAEATIRQSHEKLEERVAERTAEIAETNRRLSAQIVERSQVEAALRISEDRLRLALVASNTGLYDLNVQTGQAIVSPEYATMLGYDADTFEETSAKWIERLHPDDKTRVKTTFQAHIENRIPDYRLEFRQRTREGDWKWILSNGSIVERTPDGKALRLIGTHTDIDQRKRDETKLQHSLEEKVVLLQEIHHRVKNNLQMIQSLLSLQANKLDNPEFKASLVDCNSRIKSMALIHETLYRSDDLARMNLEGYFRQMISYLKKIYLPSGKNIETEFDIAALYLDMDASIACGLVVNELATNALKYAFDGIEQGCMQIALNRTSNHRHLELIFRDNGIGLPQKIDAHTTPSLGLRIVTMLAEDQLNGTLDIVRKEGTAFHIQFPL